MNVIWKDVFFYFLLLVVKHNIWPPDVIGWHVKHIYSTVLCRIPSHLVIKPELLYPKIGCHDLISQILKEINNHISHHFLAKSHICSQNMSASILISYQRLPPRWELFWSPKISQQFLFPIIYFSVISLFTLYIWY